MTLRILITFMLCSQAIFAEIRSWRSADGVKSLQGQFVKRDAASVTILRNDHRELIIPLDKIHKDDRAWLDENHPLPPEAPPPVTHYVYDNLEFGDTRAEVMDKLRNSKLVKATLPETLMGRTGLNGAYQTNHQVGGMDASLYFDWDDDGRLKEVTLQTSPLSGDSLEVRLKPCWEELIKLLTTLHGKPINAHDKLDIASVSEESMSATHLWKMDGGGTAMLGAARQKEGYQIAVRFTAEDIKPVIVPPSPDKVD
jgi:hypothetical protein